MKRMLVIAVLGMLALSSSGCAIMMFGQGHEGGSGSLTDAAQQVRPDTTRSKREKAPPDVGYTTPPAVTEATTTIESEAPAIAPGSESAPAPTVPSAPKPRQGHLLVGIVGGGGALGGQDYDGFGLGGLSVGGYPIPQLRVDGMVTADLTNFKGESLLGQSFKNAGGINLDITVRYYLTRDNTFLGVYPLAGAGTGTLFWDYARPVTIIEDNAPKTLENDRLNYFSLFGGAGMSLVQTRHMHVGGNLVGGVRFYGWHTGSGLDNDLLKTTGFVRTMIEASCKIW